MPGPMLHLGAIVLCGHGGQAVPTMPTPRVLVGGLPVATIAAPYSVAGCGFTTAPCVTGQWIVGAVRVTTLGQPVAIQTGVGVCAPNGAPLVAVTMQPRVIAT